MAAIFGFKEACRQADPALLEPIMSVEVETPEDYAGSIMGDLSSRRGLVQGMEDIPGGGGKEIHAKVPLSEMFGYSTTLRSMSQGRATYTMEFSHYAEAPRNVAEEINNQAANPAQRQQRRPGLTQHKGVSQSGQNFEDDQRPHQYRRQALTRLIPAQGANPRAQHANGDHQGNKHFRPWPKRQRKRRLG
ncbi:Elongation factor G [compost metagenome]